MGNLTKIDRSGTSSDWVFSYDSYSRQACARQASTTCSGTGAISYLLDPFGRASSRTKGSSVTAYSYRGLEETLAKTVQGSTTMTYAATPSGTPLAQQKNGSSSSTRYFLTDPHLDLVGLVSSSASSKGTTSFDPWGAKLSTSGNETSALGFQSDLTDPDSALVDMGTRWYVPSLGRFASRDALFGDVQAPVSLNMFAYGLASPITYADPTGMSSTPATIHEAPSKFAPSSTVTALRETPGYYTGPYVEVTSAPSTWTPEVTDASVDAAEVVDLLGNVMGAYGTAHQAEAERMLLQAMRTCYVACQREVLVIAADNGDVWLRVTTTVLIRQGDEAMATSASLLHKLGGRIGATGKILGVVGAALQLKQLTDEGYSPTSATVITLTSSAGGSAGGWLGTAAAATFCVSSGCFVLIVAGVTFGGAKMGERFGREMDELFDAENWQCAISMGSCL